METQVIISRLEKIMLHYELSAATFADRINVQRSSISHLLKGRNKPSLDFILKVVTSFPEVDLNWLLFGKGDFPNNPLEKKDAISTPISNEKPARNRVESREKQIERIVVFYDDGTFKNYKEL